MSIKKKKKRQKREVIEGLAFVKSTFNNTLISITDLEGGVIAACSSGGVGFKGAKKGTPFAAQRAGEIAAKKAIRWKMSKILYKRLNKNLTENKISATN